jgi:integrase
MAHVEDLWVSKRTKQRKANYGKGLRWQAVWDDGGDRQRKSFRTKDAAETHLAGVATDKANGTYVPAAKGRALVGDLFDPWMKTLIHYRPKTAKNAGYDIEAHLRPKWGDTAIADIDSAALQEWVTELAQKGIAPRTVGTVYGRFVNLLTWAVDEGYLAKSPAGKKVNLPRGRVTQHVYLEVAQFDALHAAMDARYQDALELDVWTGLRASELWELRERDVDRRRRRIRVDRGVVEGHIDDPKNGEGREVPYPRRLDPLIERITAGKKPMDLLFTSARGLQIRENNFKRRYFDDAVEKAGLVHLDLDMHDLRHTAASWAIASGATPKSVQRMLGHRNAKITLETSAGLFDQDLDAVADRMGEWVDRRRRPAAKAPRYPRRRYRRRLKAHSQPIGGDNAA